MPLRSVPWISIRFRVGFFLFCQNFFLLKQKTSKKSARTEYLHGFNFKGPNNYFLTEGGGGGGGRLENRKKNCLQRL